MPERTTPSTRGWSLPRLTMPELWACLAVLLPVLGSLLATISTVDLAYHLRAGAILLDSHTLPSPDPFTFTAAGLAWLDQQWGAQAVLEAIYRAGGWALLAVARAGLVGLIAWLVYRGCRSAGTGIRVAAWLTLAGFGVGLVALGMRPQLLGMGLFAATLAILAGRRAHPGFIWAIPVLVLVWSNVHGSFFLGPAAVAIAGLEDAVARRPGVGRTFLVALVSAGATLVNPFGFGVWTYALGIAADPTIRRLITEWQPTSPLSFAGALFYGSIVGAALLLVAAVRRGEDASGAGGRFLRLAWPTFVWLAVLAAIGAFAERGVAWWSIGAPIAVAGLFHLAAADDRPDAAATGLSPEPRRSLVPTVIVGAMVIVAIVLLPTWRAGQPPYGPAGLLTDAPPGLTAAVQAVAGPTDRIWNAQRWGSWLEFAVPSTPVAVDSRIELIPADAWTDHLALSSGAPDWAAILDRRGVTIVVASASEQHALIPLMRRSPDWRAAVDDEDGSVFVRADRP
jgi:hypothetical protein